MWTRERGYGPCIALGLADLPKVRGQFRLSVSVSFICSNQLNKKTHTGSTREQEQDKKGTENWRLHFAYKKTKKYIYTVIHNYGNPYLK